MSTTRRTLLRSTACAAPVLAWLARPAAAWTQRAMTPEETADWRAGCRIDPLHCEPIDKVVADLHAMGAQFDEAALRTNLVCPLCGCPLVAAR
jgi:hypothetical protein